MSRVLAEGVARCDMGYGMVHVYTNGGQGDPCLEGDLSEDLFRAGPDGVALLSSATGHTAVVRVQIWDSQPEDSAVAPTRGGADTVQAIDATTIGPGPIVLVGTADGFGTTLIPETPYQGNAQVQVICHGRNEVLRHQIAGESQVEDVEHWLVRLWPSRRPLTPEP